MDSPRLEKYFMRVSFPVTNQIVKERSILKFEKHLLKDAYTTTIHLSETNFTKSKRNFLRNSGK